MPRGLYSRTLDSEPWFDVWTYLPIELKRQVIDLAGHRGVTLLEMLETLIWNGLLRHEEARRRRGHLPSIPNRHSSASGEVQ